MIARTLHRATMLDSRRRNLHSHCGWATAFLSVCGSQNHEGCQETLSRMREVMVFAQLKVKYPRRLWVRSSRELAFRLVDCRLRGSLSYMNYTWF